MQSDDLDYLRPWRNDMNADGAISAMDLWLFAKHVFLLPGNALIEAVLALAPGLAADAGLSAADAGGPVAAGIAAIAWLLAAIVLYLVVRRAVRACRNALDALLEVFRSLRYRVTATRRRVADGFHNLLPKRQPASGAESVDIDELDVAVLRVEARLRSGYVLTATEIADKLRVQPSRAQTALDKLVDLELVKYTFSNFDGADGYCITRTGELYLAACEPGHPTPA